VVGAHPLPGAGPAAVPGLRARPGLLGALTWSAVSPPLAAEWHPTRNGALTADQVSAESRRRVWWLCAAGHEWRALIHARAREERGCPACEACALATGRPRLAAA
jgi:putative zinc ribbon protein